MAELRRRSNAEDLKVMLSDGGEGRLQAASKLTLRIEIRSGTHADFSAEERAQQDAFLRCAFKIPEEDPVIQITSPNYRFHIATDANTGHIVGYSSAVIYDDTAEFDLAYVAYGFRRQGVHSAMLASRFEYTLANGIRRVFIDANDAARKSLEKSLNGLVEGNRIREYELKDGPDMTLILLKR